MSANGSSVHRKKPTDCAEALALRRLLAAALVVSRAVDPPLERELAVILDLENEEELLPHPRPATRFAGLLTSLRMFIYAHRQAQLIEKFSPDAQDIEVCIGHLVERLQSVPPSLRFSH